MKEAEPPEIYGAVELPEEEKGGECTLWREDTEESIPCGNEIEYVFVHATTNRDDDDERRNSLACERCVNIVAPEPKLVADGGERLRDDVEHAPDRPYGTAQARKVNRNALRASLHERGFIGVDLTMHNRDYALVDLSGVPEPRQEVAEVYFESWEAAFRERDVQGFGWGVRI